MIGFVNGILSESRVGHVIIDLNGFGVIVNVPESTREELPSIGSEVRLYTHLVVKEDDMSLYGFLTRDSLDLFELLLTVSGVGPKGALSLLSFYSTENVRFLIASGDSTKLSKAPSIGKKTAERIIIDLKDKMIKEEVALTAPDDTSAKPEEENEAVLALTALGYGKSEAVSAISKVENRDSLSVNQLLKEALKYIY